ncbi:MAG: GntR family transcriptional regulator [Betaproteobacteria bacterium]|nr:GntR family transcriptional regulator [Betaproteobacteria bacterium]
MNTDTASPRLITRTPLFEKVAERLRNRIFAHDLPPGSWIDEQALTAEYGISRTPLREALKVLAFEGLVTLRPGRGCQVTQLEDRDLDELFPILALLEGRCVYEATLRADEAGRAAIRALHEQLESMAREENIAGFFDINQQFHLQIQELAGNRWLVQMIQDTRKVLKLTRFHSLFIDGRLQESLQEHRRIVAAILEQDPTRAQSEMENHLLQGRRAIAHIG